MSRFLVACVMLLFAPIVLQAQGSSGASSPTFQWKRSPQSPIIPAAVDTWMESGTANPDLLLKGNTYYLYYRGQYGGHDRIGIAATDRGRFDGVSWTIRRNPIIDLGKPGSCDDTHCLEPSTVLVKGRVFLYYTGVNSRGERTICLAHSDDGTRFTKYEANPLMKGSAPEVVYYKGTFYLYISLPAPGKESLEIHYATSKDGMHFTTPSPAPILTAGPKGSWDSFTIETPRIFSEGNLFFMVYCGSDRYKDYPWNAGLATSRDLIHWEKYSGNPIFSRGLPGTWDEGAIWYTTIEKINGRYYMWYQGYGGGRALTEPYGGGRSQIGVATLDAPYFYVQPGKTK